MDIAETKVSNVGNDKMTLQNPNLTTYIEP